MKEINVEKLYELQKDKNITILDVRSKEEYDEVHVPGAKLYELDKIHTWSQELDKDERYYIICKSGGRSRIAQMMLGGIGFDKCYNVVGGTTAWIERDFETQ